MAFESLPDQAQARIASFLTTSSRPAHVQLGRVCKGWRAVATRLLAEDPARVHYTMSRDMEEGPGAVDREVERLRSLSRYVRRYGPYLEVLIVHGPAQYLVNEDYPVVQRAAQVVPSILGALAGAGRQPGGLPLLELQLPVFGSCSVPTLTRALSVCPQLQRLSLWDSCSGQTTQASAAALDQLPAVLHQLTQLKVLEIQSGIFMYYPPPAEALADGMLAPAGPMFIEEILDPLLASLPSSLVELSIKDYHQEFGRRWYTFTTRSLRHLVSLERLTLPNYTTVTESFVTRVVPLMGGEPAASSSSSSAGSSRGPADGHHSHAAGSSSSSRGLANIHGIRVEGSYYNYLADLTSVTYVACGSALQRRCAPLLAFPHLAELRAGHADPDQLRQLVDRPALRSLGCLFGTVTCDELPAQADAMSRVTQLTSLGLVLHQRQTELQAARSGRVRLSPGQGASNILALVVSRLTGLQKLRLEPQQLQLINLKPLTALTSVAVLIQYLDRYDAGEKMAKKKLEPVRSKLQEVPCRTWPGLEGTLLGPA